MVQTEDQYHFIYRAVLEEIEASNPNVSEPLKLFMEASKTQNDIGVLKKKVR